MVFTARVVVDYPPCDEAVQVPDSMTNLVDVGTLLSQSCDLTLYFGYLCQFGADVQPIVDCKRDELADGCTLFFRAPPSVKPSIRPRLTEGKDEEDKNMDPRFKGFNLRNVASKLVQPKTRERAEAFVGLSIRKLWDSGMWTSLRQRAMTIILQSDYISEPEVDILAAFIAWGEVSHSGLSLSATFSDTCV
jgi:hypothetical protein